jgi:hypothetical protein
MTGEEIKAMLKEREARAQAQILEMVCWAKDVEEDASKDE